MPPPPDNSGEGKGLKRAVVALLVLAVVAVLGVGGLALLKAVGGNSLPGAGGGESGTERLLSSDDIDALLNGRTTALKTGDEDAYLAPFKGKAKDDQRKIFRNLRKVPFAEAKFKVLMRSDNASGEYGSDVKIGLDVAFVHQIKGVDVRPVSEWYRWTVERESTSAEPHITAVGGSPSAYGAASNVYYPAPWDVYDDMYVKRQPHTVTIAAKKNAADASRFAPVIEQAAEYDLELWKAQGPSTANMPEGFLVVVEPDRKMYTKLYNNAGDDIGWDAGQSVPMPAFTERYDGGKKAELQFGGARIKMDASLNRFTSPSWRDGVGEISRHEIAHALVQPLDNGEYTDLFGNEENDVRTWVAEGFAEYIEHRVDKEAGEQQIRGGLADGKFDGELPDHKFDEQLNHSVSMNYALSYLAFQFIEEKSSETAVFEFVAAHYKQPKNLDQQLRTAVGMDEKEFRSAWAQYVRNASR